MKSTSKLCVTALILLVIAVAAWNTSAQKPPPPKAPTWEYKVVTESDKIPLNDLGAQGWELVTVEMGGAQETYYFKRAK